jgi:phospholipid transport system substrate-binding protein
MIRLERMAFAVLFSLAVVFVSNSVRAESATDFIKGRQEAVMSILKAPPGERRDAKVGAVLADMLDFDQLAQESLASHWKDLTAAQRGEFTETLHDLVRRSYERNIKDVINFNVEYLREETPDGEPVVVVYTRATPKTNTGEDPVEIDYRLEKNATGKWRVVDIITEDSSLVANYRSQFHRIIKKDGYDALIHKMKNKLAKGDK